MKLCRGNNCLPNKYEFQDLKKHCDQWKVYPGLFEFIQVAITLYQYNNIIYNISYNIIFSDFQTMFIPLIRSIKNWLQTSMMYTITDVQAYFEVLNVYARFASNDVSECRTKNVQKVW